MRLVRQIAWWLPRLVLGVPLCILIGFVTGPIDTVRGLFGLDEK